MGLLKDVRLQRICHFKNTELTRLVSCCTQLCVSLGTTRGSRTCTTERRFGATAKTRYYITECLLSYYLITINGGRNVESQYSSMTPLLCLAACQLMYGTFLMPLIGYACNLNWRCHFIVFSASFQTHSKMLYISRIGYIYFLQIIMEGNTGL